MKSSDEKDNRILQLENENRMLQDQIFLLNNKVDILTQGILHAAKQRYGASSEKTPKINGQYYLIDEGAIENAVEADTSVVHIKAHKRPVRKKGDRKKLTEGLYRETVECIINPADATCDIC